MSHVFSCEKDAEKRKWIACASFLAADTVQRASSQSQQAAHAAAAGRACCHTRLAEPCLFVDIATLGQPEAECATHRKKCLVPEVDLLVLGTSCKDMSKANPNPQAAAGVLGQMSSKGGSAQTFQGMLAYLSSKCPPLVLFENVDAMDDSKGAESSNMDIFLAETSSRGYESQVCMTDAAEFGGAARRRRVYVLLVRAAVNPSVDFVSRPLSATFATFRALLVGCLRGGPCVNDVLLDQASTSVQADLQLRSDKRAKQKEKESAKTSPPVNVPQTWVEQHMQFAHSARLRLGGKGRLRSWPATNGFKFWGTGRRMHWCCSSCTLRRFASEICLNLSPE